MFPPAVHNTHGSGESCREIGGEQRFTRAPWFHQLRENKKCWQHGTNNAGLLPHVKGGLGVSGESGGCCPFALVHFLSGKDKTIFSRERCPSQNIKGNIAPPPITPCGANMSADGSRHPSRLADIRQRTPDTKTRALVAPKEDARYDTQGVAARFGRNISG